MSEPFAFHYTRAGASAKPAVLFLHGFMGDSQSWQDLIALLAGDFYCLAIDLPGHGNTRVRGDDSHYTMEKCATGVIRLLSNLGIDKCHLVGYSMGGRLALYLALHFPERFARVLLESASPGLQTEAERRERRAHDENLARALETTEFAVFLRQWYTQPLFASLQRHPGFENLLASRQNNSPTGLAKSLRHMGLGRQPALWEMLSSLQLPLLLVTGEFDPKFCAIATMMAKLVPGTRTIVVAGAGHNIHFEKPQDYADIAKRFLIATETTR